MLKMVVLVTGGGDFLIVLVANEDYIGELKTLESSCIQSSLHIVLVANEDYMLCFTTRMTRATSSSVMLEPEGRQRPRVKRSSDTVPPK